MPNSVEHLLTSLEAAKVAKVHRATLNRWVGRGLLKPAYDPPGRTGARLFDPDEVARVAAELEAAGADA